MAEYILEMSHISKSFPGVKVLDDVTFRVRSGEVHALMGENGAGKSTLMKILMGIYTADAGVVALEGRSMPETTAELVLPRSQSVPENTAAAAAGKAGFGGFSSDADVPCDFHRIENCRLQLRWRI